MFKGRTSHNRFSSRQSQSNLIELHFNRTQTKKNWTIELNRTFDFRTLDFCKTGVEKSIKGFGGSSYFSITRVFRNRTIPAEMASDALWVVSFKYVVKGYQESRFDVKEDEQFKL